MSELNRGARIDYLQDLCRKQQEALALAVDIIMRDEPGDSRAVSNEAVALAAVATGDTSEPVMRVIRDANDSMRMAILGER